MYLVLYYNHKEEITKENKQMSVTMIISLTAIVVGLINIVNCAIFLYQWYK